MRKWVNKQRMKRRNKKYKEKKGERSTKELENKIKKNFEVLAQRL